MSVRVVARVRPLLNAEQQRDVIVNVTGDKNTVKLPNPKNESEAFSFQFQSVHGQDATQQQFFENEGIEAIFLAAGRDTDAIQSRPRSNTFSRESMSHYLHTGSQGRAKPTRCEGESPWPIEVLFRDYSLRSTEKPGRWRRTALAKRKSR